LPERKRVCMLTRASPKLDGRVEEKPLWLKSRCVSDCSLEIEGGSDPPSIGEEVSTSD